MMHTGVESILHEVRKVIVGKDDVLEKILMTILSGGHVLLDDVPGTGKTTTALAFSRALGLQYGRIQFTPDVLPSDIVGFSLYRRDTGAFTYQPGAVMTNLLLADEINRTSSKTQSALLEAMEERRVSVDGETYPLPAPFVVLATQNPVGSAGTTRLPESQLDRFLIRVSMGYPDFRSQVNILRDRHDKNPLDDIRPVVDKGGLMDLIAAVTAVEIRDSIYEYVTTLAEATRTHPLVELGLSPRGALALCRMAKAHAFLRGRDFVTPEDVSEVFPDVAAHRLVLSSKARMMESDPGEITREILQTVSMPALGGAGK